MKYAMVGAVLAAAVSAQGVGEPLYPSGVNSPPPSSNFPKNAFVLSTVKTTDNQVSHISGIESSA